MYRGASVDVEVVSNRWVTQPDRPISALDVDYAFYGLDLRNAVVHDPSRNFIFIAFLEKLKVAAL
jgi:hypothetical protein